MKCGKVLWQKKVRKIMFIKMIKESIILLFINIHINLWNKICINFVKLQGQFLFVHERKSYNTGYTLKKLHLKNVKGISSKLPEHPCNWKRFLCNLKTFLTFDWTISWNSELQFTIFSYFEMERTSLNLTSFLV